jgi:hypothetical protein
MGTNYLSLRYNDVSMKGAHNSYQRDETLIEQIKWNASNPADTGCRAVELDISQSDNGLAKVSLILGTSLLGKAKAGANSALGCSCETTGAGIGRA